MVERCPAGNWLNHAHQFEARFDSEPAPPTGKLKLMWSEDFRDMMVQMVKRTYVQDICTRCGETRERQQEPKADAKGESGSVT